MKPNLLIVAACLFVFVSCKKSKVNPPSKSPDVYVVGQDNFNPVYWKNGVETKLTTQYGSKNLTYANAVDIAISGNDTYICGLGRNDEGINIACYWKNGILDTLPSVTKVTTNGDAVSTAADAIVVSGNDVYIGGSQASNFYSPPNGSIIWKNGIPNTFGGPTASINGLFLSGGNLYSAGPDRDSTGNFAGYYKNGSLIKLFSFGSTYDIYVSGNDVYTAGITGGGKAAYWKNGVLNQLSTKSSNAWSINVSGNDVYVGGDEVVNLIGYSTAVIWKNGQPIYLSEFDESSTVSQVLVSGGDVYAVGWIYDSQARTVATIWKNGVETPLAPGESFAYTLFVK